MSDSDGEQPQLDDDSDDEPAASSKKRKGKGGLDGAKKPKRNKAGAGGLSVFADAPDSD